ncbi:MAG: helix-turn-helix domain-containing protein [Rhodospirillales bacterium]|nr:helix-turn-helix domain-containing protein [Rhodospirillales bacterium]
MGRPPKEKAPADDELDSIIRSLAEKLAAARKARGLTQASVAAMADMTQQQVFGLEQGTSNVTIRTLARVAKVLDLDLQALFSNVGSSSNTRLFNALAAFQDVLKERVEQDQAFLNEIIAVLERSKTEAVRNQTELNDDES